MKKIYTITLEDDIPLSDKVKNDLKLLCFLLYDDIMEMEETPGSILEKKNFIYNKLLDSFDGEKYDYHFKSEQDSSNWMKYEPFMIDDKTFGFTTIDGTINESDIAILLEENKKLVSSNYQFKINSYIYCMDSYRNKIINNLSHSVYNIDKENKVYNKVRLRSLLSILKI